MADYQLTTPDENGPVLRTADQAWIPADPANRDWEEYREWVNKGNTPDPYVPPPEPEPVPPAAELTDAVLFLHENRIRSLEGVPPLTLDEFKTEAISAAKRTKGK